MKLSRLFSLALLATVVSVFIFGALASKAPAAERTKESLVELKLVGFAVVPVQKTAPAPGATTVAQLEAGSASAAGLATSPEPWAWLPLVAAIATAIAVSPFIRKVFRA